MIFSVANHGMADGEELRSDLVLQSGHELNPNQRRIGKKAFDRVSKFSAGRLRVSRGAQLLKYAATPKIVHQRPSLELDTAAHYRQVLPHRSMVEKLAHQRISIRRGLRKEQDPRGKTIDPMDDQRPLPLPFELRGK